MSRIKIFSLLSPRLHVLSILDIDLEALCRQGICGIMLDLDNTIVQRDLERFSEDTLSWIKEVKKRGFKVCIISNNQPKRVYPLAQEVDLPAVCQAIKPLKTPFHQALEILGTMVQETAIIGDQIFTDIFGGNRLGLYTILVTPIPGKEFWATRLINRKLEKIILWWIKKKNK